MSKWTILMARVITWITIVVAAIVALTLSPGCTSDDLSDGCASDEWQCGKQCIVRSQPCGSECAPGLFRCAAEGVCRTAPDCGGCAANETQCGSACANLQSSRDHCGDCDKPCVATEACVAGECTACPDSDKLLQDEQNCGKCGFVCPGGTCDNGRCKLGELLTDTVLATGLVVGPNPAEAVVMAILADGGGLQRVPFQADVMETDLKLSFQGGALAADRIQWLVPNGIRAIPVNEPLKGAAVESYTPCGVDCTFAMSAPDVRSYWIDDKTGGLYRLIFIGPNPVPQLIGTLGTPRAIAAGKVDRADVHVVVDNANPFGGPPVLRRYHDAGGPTLPAPEAERELPELRPAILLLDETHLYIGSYGLASQCKLPFSGIVRLPRDWTDTTPIEVVAQVPKCNSIMTMALDATDTAQQWIFFANQDDPNVFRAPRSGGTPEVVASKRAHVLSPLAAKAGRLYFVDNPTLGDGPDGGPTGPQAVFVVSAE